MSWRGLVAITSRRLLSKSNFIFSPLPATSQIGSGSERRRDDCRGRRGLATRHSRPARQSLALTTARSRHAWLTRSQRRVTVAKRAGLCTFPSGARRQTDPRHSGATHGRVMDFLRLLFWTSTWVALSFCTFASPQYAYSCPQCLLFLSTLWYDHSVENCRLLDHFGGTYVLREQPWMSPRSAYEFPVTIQPLHLC